VSPILQPQLDDGEDGSLLEDQPPCIQAQYFNESRGINKGKRKAHFDQHVVDKREIYVN
jgi:hypothetical protein